MYFTVLYDPRNRLSHFSLSWHQNHMFFDHMHTCQLAYTIYSLHTIQCVLNTLSLAESFKPLLVQCTHSSSALPYDRFYDSIRKLLYFHLFSLFPSFLPYFNRSRQFHLKCLALHDNYWISPDHCACCKFSLHKSFQNFRIFNFAV